MCAIYSLSGLTFLLPLSACWVSLHIWVLSSYSNSTVDEKGKSIHNAKEFWYLWMWNVIWSHCFSIIDMFCYYKIFVFIPPWPNALSCNMLEKVFLSAPCLGSTPEFNWSPLPENKASFNIYKLSYLINSAEILLFYTFFYLEDGYMMAAFSFIFFCELFLHWLQVKLNVILFFLFDR